MDSEGNNNMFGENCTIVISELITLCLLLRSWYTVGGNDRLKIRCGFFEHTTYLKNWGWGLSFNSLLGSAVEPLHNGIKILLGPLGHLRLLAQNVLLE